MYNYEQTVQLQRDIHIFQVMLTDAIQNIEIADYATKLARGRRERKAAKRLRSNASRAFNHALVGAKEWFISKGHELSSLPYGYDHRP